MGRPLKCATAGLPRATISLMMYGAHWGGAPTCWAMVATARAIAVRLAEAGLAGWWLAGPLWRCHHRV